MNWDWDKLQEKKQRQSKGKGPSPDFSELKKKFQKFRNFRASGLKIVILIIVLLWLVSGFYIVNPDEVGVVQRFGAFTRITQPGPHYHLPYPVESVKTPSVTEIKRLEIGFRTPSYTREITPQNYRKIPKESLMLTGDENIVDVQFIVQFMIKDASNYLFNISKPQKTVKDAAEAAMRDVIGSKEIESVLTVEKFIVQDETKNLLQEILNSYDSGIQVTAVKLQDVHPPEQVMTAFKDVASAREDKSKFINNAKAFRNNLLPKARGEVASILNEAEAYKETKVRQAKGASTRFLNIWEEYKQVKEVTEKRLYLETMESVLGTSGQKMIFSQKAAEKMVPYLPLSEVSGSREMNKGKMQEKPGK